MNIVHFCFGVKSTQTVPTTARTLESFCDQDSEWWNSSELSTMSSLRRKSARRKARRSIELSPQMRSMKKSIQLLGPEAAGAVVKGTDLSPNKLRYMEFGRQMRGYMRRYM